MAGTRVQSARRRIAVLSMVVCACLAVTSAHGSARANTAAASDCTRGATRTALSSFVAAFNGGRYQELEALFAVSPLFQWYSSNAPGLRRAAAAHDRESLIAYFHARHRKSDRLRLVRFTFTGNTNGGGNFVLELKRSAVDYRRGAWFGLIGKGAAVCSDASSEHRVQLIVLSLGGPGSNRR